MALAIWSLPASTAASRRSLENHCRILFRARGLWTNFSQSRLGPASAVLAVKISTVSPLSSVDSSATSRPLTRAPMRPVPDLGVHGVGEVDRGRALRQRDHVALGVNT